MTTSWTPVIEADEQPLPSTGKIGDGKIFVYPIEQVMSIRTGQSVSVRAVDRPRFHPIRNDSTTRLEVLSFRSENVENQHF